MTPYDLVFFPILGIACGLAALASFWAARRSGILVPASLLTLGMISLWGGLFIGSDLGYRVWQSMPDPPDEAFQDPFPVVALLLGWFPAAGFCGCVFALTRLVQQLRTVDARGPASR